MSQQRITAFSHFTWRELPLPMSKGENGYVLYPWLDY